MRSGFRQRSLVSEVLRLCDLQVGKLDPKLHAGKDPTSLTLQVLQNHRNCWVYMVMDAESGINTALSFFQIN